MSLRIRNIIIATILFALGFSFSSQSLNKLKLVSKPKYLPSEVISYDVRDANGDVCAGLMIITDLIGGFDYSSYNGIVRKTNVAEGKDIVYVSGNERVLEVFKAGYSPLRIVLTDYDVYLQPGQMWQLEISSNITNKSLAYKGKFVINTIPSDAELKIEGKRFGKTPFFSELMFARTYNINLSLKDYEYKTIELRVLKDTTITETIRLKPKFGYLEIRTDYPDIRVYVDNVLQRGFIMNFPNKVPLGYRRIKLQRDFHEVFQKDINITANDDPTSAMIIEPEFIRAKGRFTVSASPNDAEIYLDDDYIGEGKVDEYIEAGMYKLLVEADGYRSFEEDIRLDANGKYSKNVRLDNTGVLTLVGTVAASIYINGRYYGTLPLNPIKLDAGDYELTASLGGYDDFSDDFEIEAGDVELEIELTKSRFKFFRFSLFGDGRLTDIANSFSLSGGYHKAILREALIEDLVGPFEKRRIDMLEVGFSFLLTPFMIKGGYCGGGKMNAGFSQSGRDSLSLTQFYGSLTIIPFSLWEVVYPSAGMFFMYSEAGIIYEDDIVNKIITKNFGYSFDIRIQSRGKDSKMGFFIDAGYRKFLIGDYYKDHPYIQGGALFYFN